MRNMLLLFGFLFMFLLLSLFLVGFRMASLFLLSFLVVRIWYVAWWSGPWMGATFLLLLWLMFGGRPNRGSLIVRFTLLLKKQKLKSSICVAFTDIQIWIFCNIVMTHRWRLFVKLLWLTVYRIDYICNIDRTNRWG